VPATVAEDRIAEGTFRLGPSRTYRLDQIRDAHKAMEANSTSGKLVVVTAPDDEEES